MGQGKKEPGLNETPITYKAYLNRHLRAHGVGPDAKVQPYTKGEWLRAGKPETGGHPRKVQ